MIDFLWLINNLQIFSLTRLTYNLSQVGPIRTKLLKRVGSPSGKL